MVLEQIVSSSFLERRPSFSFVLAFVYTIIASLTAFIFFRDALSLSILFLVTILLLPSLMNLVADEEALERKVGAKQFFKTHKNFFKVYGFLFLGIFLAYLLLIWFLQNSGVDLNLALAEQLKILGAPLSQEKIASFSNSLFFHALAIFSINVAVAAILFILSFFYGAGSIFLLVWNASIFATFIFITVRDLGNGVNHALALFGSLALYTVPEIFGFLLAAVAGGVFSKAILSEKPLSSPFSNVMKDAFILLVLSFIVLLVAAFLEAYLGTSLVRALVL